MIYLDYQATTPLDERVLDAMLPYLQDVFANASSAHQPGRAAAAGVADAREEVASLLGCRPPEVVFTSGATEANNLAIKGMAATTTDRRHLVTCATEHSSVLEPLRRLAGEGFTLSEVGVDSHGVVDLAALEHALRPDTLLVSVMAANNEIGTLAPMRLVSDLAHDRGAVVHCDATQAVGKVPFDVHAAGVDLASLSAHKLYGPKGVGALYVRRRLLPQPLPLLDGGGHERGLRSGTLNVAGCVGLGAACATAAVEMATEGPRLRGLAELLGLRLTESLTGVSIVGHPHERIPGNLAVGFADVEADAVVAAMPDVAVSTGSACSSAVPGPSHVLRALGLSEAEAASVVRFGAGRHTTGQEIDAAALRVVEVVSEQRRRHGARAVTAGRR